MLALTIILLSKIAVSFIFGGLFYEKATREYGLNPILAILTCAACGAIIGA